MSTYISNNKKHTEQTQQDRSESYFYNMRIFHNFIKKTLYNKYTKNINNLLELAVGKFGDMNKIFDNNVKHVVGYDIDTESINEGEKRVIKKLGETNQKNAPIIELYVKDLSRNIIEHSVPFDVVSSQFAFHYFFESENTFNTIITSIKNNLKPNGIFMGTMFDGKSLLHLKDKNSDVFEIKDLDTKFKLNFYNSSSESLFGNKLSVYINGTVLDKPMDEYIVDFDMFVELMKNNGFELIETSMFETLYQSYLKNPRNKTLNGVQKQVSFLNRTFVFRRERGPLCKIETVYLTECQWPQIEISDLEPELKVEPEIKVEPKIKVEIKNEIKEEYNSVLLSKYKRALKKLIEDKAEKDKEDLQHILEYFENPEKVLSKKDLSKDAKDYYNHVYKQFVEKLKN